MSMASWCRADSAIAASKAKSAALQFAREQAYPVFRHLLRHAGGGDRICAPCGGLPGANTTEIDRDCKDPAIALITEWRTASGEIERRSADSDLGGTMRLGLQECRLKPGTLAHKLYGKDVVAERHRHRYEFNNAYREAVEKAGMTISAQSMDGLLVEMVEMPDHPWFLACQAHPEFLSTRATATRCSAASSRRHARTKSGISHLEDTENETLRFRCRLGPTFLPDCRPLRHRDRCSCSSNCRQLKEITARLGIPFIFKSSFDKANRSSGTSFRGPGMEEGLKVLQEVKRQIGVPVLTDVHEYTPMEEVASVVDVLQTPAFLCRQTDFIQKVAASASRSTSRKASSWRPGT